MAIVLVFEALAAQPKRFSQEEVQTLGQHCVKLRAVVQRILDTKSRGIAFLEVGIPLYAKAHLWWTATTRGGVGAVDAESDHNVIAAGGKAWNSRLDRDALLA